MVPLASSLDCAFVILDIKISNPFFLMNSISLLFFVPFHVLFFLLAAPGISCSEPGIEILILLPEDLYRFYHRFQEVH